MPTLSPKERRVLEIMLIVVCLGLACLVYVMQGYKMAILHLFFLPVALGGFFLGRYRAGVLALFSALAVTVATGLALGDLAPVSSPLVIALAVAVWAAALGLTALLIGTLSDDNAAKTKELHDAYVGVVEVLAQYLQGGHPRLKARSTRIAELSHQVALAMRLQPREIDNIRVAALLHDIGQLEVTTRVMQRAVDALEMDSLQHQQSTFQGLDLVLSLGTVLREAIPLILTQGPNEPDTQATGMSCRSADVPVGARIIRLVRSYVALASEASPEEPASHSAICQRLRREALDPGDQPIIDVLERVASDSGAPGRTAPVSVPLASSASACETSMASR